MTDLTAEISNLQKEISKRARQAWTFDAENFLAPHCGITGKYRMRIPTMREDASALFEAKTLVKKLSRDSGLEQEASFVKQIEMLCLLNRICLMEGRDFPLFSTVDWMLDHLSLDEATILWNHYQECLRLSGTIKLDLNAEDSESLAIYLVNADSEKSLDVLMRFSNPQLALLAILLSHKIEILKSMVKPIEENETK